MPKYIDPLPNSKIDTFISFQILKNGESALILLITILHYIILIVNNSKEDEFFILLPVIVNLYTDMLFLEDKWFQIEEITDFLSPQTK